MALDTGTRWAYLCMYLLDMGVRATTGYRKRDGVYRISHEHQSTQFDPTSGNAALELEL
jgi:hypothetical protein